MFQQDFIEILSYLYERYEGKIILSTNSLLINNDNIAELVKMCDSFEISVDGIDESTCALVRGKGVFNKVCQKINLLKESGAKNINLSMVFSDKNEHLMNAFRELNVALGTTPICRIFSAIGRGANNRFIFTEKTEDDIYFQKNT
ncbi:hypothetical protein AZF37_01660 [endosymbiont 'TC1' of Trimyema compressum]|nr:hypothetical protein AZF37_01660 [endosymbiont 'TC1' of Trimyema compressum]